MVFLTLRGRIAVATAVCSATISHSFADQRSGADLYNADTDSSSVVQVVAQDYDTATAQPVGSQLVTEVTPPQPEAMPQPEAESVEAMPANAAEPAPVASDAVTYAPMPCACCNSTCCTKKKKEAATAAMKGAYKGMFYGNQFGYLNDKCYDGPSFIGDNFKGLCDGKLDVGGELRARYHNEHNHRGLGLTGVDDNFWLSRVRAFANYRMNEFVRLYGEVLYADSGGNEFNPRPIEENRGDIQNAFADFNLTENLTARLGRQELLYGAQRLVSPLDWANTRRTFDAYRFLYSGDNGFLDGFYANPTILDRGTWEIDETNDDVSLYGLYGSTGASAFETLDTYYLGLQDDIQNFSFHTIGSRVAGATDGGLLYEFEGGIQFGDNSPAANGGSHSAEFVTIGLGKQLDICVCGDSWKPTVWFWYDYASGEDDPLNIVAGNQGDNGFHHYFPLAHKYNGFMDLFGRRNLHDFNAQFITPILGSKVNMLAWYHYFALVEDTTPYNVDMTPFLPGVAAGDRELGHEIDLLFTVTMNPRETWLIGFSHFFTGDYYDTTLGVPTNDDAQFFYAQWQRRL